MQQSYVCSVGIDLGRYQHQVCILGADGKSEELVVPHRGEATSALVQQLLEISKDRPERLAVGLEAPRGAVVETLLGHGFHVYAINPKQLDRFRDRYTVAGAKDDRRDAFVLAASLCTDRGAFRRSRVEEDEVVELRELSRAQDELNEEITRLHNQLGGLLQAYYPQFLAVCPDVTSHWGWALWEMAPTPEAGRSLTPEQVEPLLKQHRVRRIKTEEVLERLGAAGFKLSAGILRASQSHIELLLPRLKVAMAQRHECEKRIEGLLEALATKPGTTWAQDIAVMRSMPGIGTGVLTILLSEATTALQQRDYGALRTWSGVAPVTRQSGKRRQVCMRRGYQRRLGDAIYHWMRTYTVRDAYGKQAYKALRARGHTHGQAMRSVADRTLKTLMAMLRSGKKYDPARRQRVATA